MVQKSLMLPDGTQLPTRHRCRSEKAIGAHAEGNNTTERCGELLLRTHTASFPSVENRDDVYLVLRERETREIKHINTKFPPIVTKSTCRAGLLLSAFNHDHDR